MILVLVCVFGFSSCDLLEKFISFDRVETNAPTAQDPNNNEASTPDMNDSESKEPGDDKSEETTYYDHDCTTPDDQKPEESTPQKEPDQTTPEQTTPEDDYPCDTTPEVTTPVPADPQTFITVHMQFQSGGIHAIEEWVKVEAPCTFVELCAEFIQKYDLSGFYIVSYLNKEPVDINSDVCLQDGDHIYLEEYSGATDDEPTCPHEWIDSYCPLCDTMCEHSEWDDNRHCLTCGAWLGVDLLYIEFYMDGEYYGCTSTIEYTVGEHLMFQFWRSWEDLTLTYDVYVGDVLVTDQYYMVVESCNIYLVTRTYDYQ
jgi:hypothetical protein